MLIFKIFKNQLKLNENTDTSKIRSTRTIVQRYCRKQVENNTLFFSEILKQLTKLLEILKKFLFKIKSFFL